MVMYKMLREWLIEYSQDVLNGNLIACQKHKWACQRFLRDIEREGTEDFPYLFDEEKAYKFLNWMTLFKHTKGALEGQQIQPAPIQIFIFGNIYGWVKPNGFRRFKKAYWQVAKKNAKSQSLSCVGSFEASAFGEANAQVYCAATKTDQAKIVWDEIWKQIEGCDALKDKFRVRYGKIEHPKSGSFIKALSKEDGKRGDGVHTQCGIVDELHLHETSEMLDNLASSMAARQQPLLIAITTAGFNLSHPAYRVEYKYVSELLDPNNPKENETYFAMVNELDPEDKIENPSVWEKANPILCSYPEGVDFIKEELNLALQVPDKMRGFLTKNMNVWIDSKPNGYIPLNKWKECEEEFTLEDMRGLPCIVGVDLSAKIDLTSLSFLFIKDGFLYVHNHSFMPEDTLEQKRKSDKVDYWLWKEQGYITMTPGSVVDYEFLEVYIETIEKEYGLNVLEVCSDPWNASQFMQNLEKKGYVTVEIRQGIQTLGPPTKDFRERVFSKTVRHNANPVLTWSIGNAITKKDANENFMLDKSKSTERIDPIASVLNAHVRSIVLEQEQQPDLNDHILSDDWSF